MIHVIKPSNIMDCYFLMNKHKYVHKILHTYQYTNFKTRMKNEQI